MYEVMTIHLSAHNERLKQELSVLTSKLNEGFDILIQYPSEESGGDHVVWIYLYKPLPKHFPALNVRSNSFLLFYLEALTKINKRTQRLRALLLARLA